MSSVTSDIKSFYNYYHTSVKINQDNTKEWVLQSVSLERCEYAHAALDATIFLVQNLALTFFGGFSTIVTLGSDSEVKEICTSNAYKALVHAGTIPISLFGIISPQTINNNFLQLKAVSIIQPVNDTIFSKVAARLGDIELRQRWPASA